MKQPHMSISILISLYFHFCFYFCFSDKPFNMPQLAYIWTMLKGVFKVPYYKRQIEVLFTEMHLLLNKSKKKNNIRKKVKYWRLQAQIKSLIFPH